jgi:hypothetical protein
MLKKGQAELSKTPIIFIRNGSFASANIALVLSSFLLPALGLGILPLAFQPAMPGRV